MESVPLTLAHIHARNASEESHKANPVAASEEHDLAAGEFASAAKITGDAEALRTLRLLENHHQKLAELLKFRPEELHSSSPQLPTPETSKSASKELEDAPVRSALKSIETSPRHVSNVPPPILQAHHRDVRSSIASNLASARGIPSNRQRRNAPSPLGLTLQLADAESGGGSKKSRFHDREAATAPIREEEPNRLVPGALLPSKARVSDPDVNPTSPSRVDVQPSGPEDSFSKFYATFEGLLSKLSAPLAFAGLPLIPEEPSKASEKMRHSERATVDPDVTKIFSKAALRVVREDGFAGAAESFYVVPTSGGTMSYATMLTRGESAGGGGDDDEFVDARELPQSSGSVDLKRRQHHQLHHQQQRKSTKTVEELLIENEALKSVAVDLGDRLRNFELNAQKSSMALHMSMRALHSPTASTAVAGKPAAVAGSEPGGRADLELKVRSLEDEIKALKKEAKKVGRENAKLMAVVERYRERWEKLKDGARERVRGEEEARA